MYRGQLLSHRRVPERDLVVHRSEELERLTSALEPVIEGYSPNNSFLFGSSGTGKTMAARIAVRELRQEADVSTSYLNCWKKNQRNDLLFQAADELLAGVTLHRQSMSQGEWLTKLQAEPEHPRVVIVDEVDQLEDKSILYDLWETPGLTMICIANSAEGLYTGMEDRTRSRLAMGRRIEFDAYSVSQLATILTKRAENAGIRSAVSDHQLERIAAASDGDARLSIMALSIAYDKARESNGRTDIEDEMIDGTTEEARKVLRHEYRGRLNDFQEHVFELVEIYGPAGTAELHEKHSEHADSPKSKRTLRTHLGKMVGYEVLGERGTSQNKKFYVR
jgi:Cdc6-like AAA superfamily ATPase